jgi:anti-anti-sigma factor
MPGPDRSESVVINIHQPLTGSWVKEFIATINDTLSDTMPRICVLDFLSCESIDSYGIGALFSIAQKFHQKNAQLSLKNLNSKLYQIFTDTDLDHYFSIENEGELKEATADLFENYKDAQLVIDKQINGNTGIFRMKGVMNHPNGSRYLKQQLLLSLINCKLILLNMEELVFFDSLSVGTAINMNNLLKKTGGSLHICGAKLLIKDLLNTLCINAIIPVFKTQKEALEVWGMELV